VRERAPEDIRAGGQSRPGPENRKHVASPVRVRQVVAGVGRAPSFTCVTSNDRIAARQRSTHAGAKLRM
jgi:hypothetical protein